MFEEKSILAKFLIIFICVFLSFPINAWSIDDDIIREQEDAYDYVKVDYENIAPQKPPSFWRYFWRVLAAPFVVMAVYPRSEETDIYNTYLEYVNKGTDRNWKRKEFGIKKSQRNAQGGVNRNEENDENENTSQEPKGSSSV